MRWPPIYLAILLGWWYHSNQWGPLPKWWTWFILSILEKTKVARDLRYQSTRSIIHWRQILDMRWDPPRTRPRCLWPCFHHPWCWQIHSRLLPPEIWQTIPNQLSYWAKTKRCRSRSSTTTQWFRRWSRLIRLCIWLDPKETKDWLLQIRW